MTENYEPKIMAIEPCENNQEDGMKFTIEELPKGRLSIKVMGIGGCGGNILDTLIGGGLADVEFIAVNTDEQALESCRALAKLQIGQRVTQGYGTGSNPDVGRQSALENTEDLTELLGNADMLFLIAGLGGGTGTGAAPVIASLARQMGILTVATVIKPYSFEGKRRSQVADEGLDELVEQVDTAIVISNERLLEQVELGTGFFDGFQLAHRIVNETLEGVVGILSKRGIMNTDFADLRAILQDAGTAVVGTAERSGRDAAMQASRDAIASPVMEHERLVRARRILVNITGSRKFGMHDATEALQLIQRQVSSDADLIVGVVQDDSMGEMVKVLIMASGFSRENFQLRAQDGALFTEGPSASGGSSWQSERAVELLGTDQPQLAPEASVEGAQQAAPAGAEMPQPGAGPQPDVPAEGPIEFMPPPNIQADEEAVRGNGTKPSFFARHSIFR